MIRADFTDAIVAEVKAVEVGETEVLHVLEATARQAEMNQHPVVSQLVRRDTTAGSIQVTNISKTTQFNACRAGKSQPTTDTILLRALCLTEQFIISLWTLEHAVTHVVRMQTHCGPTTAVESWTPVPLTPVFIPLTHTVSHPVTAEIDGETVVLARTLEVCTGGAVIVGAGFRLHWRQVFEAGAVFIKAHLAFFNLYQHIIFAKI